MRKSLLFVFSVILLWGCMNSQSAGCEDCNKPLIESKLFVSLPDYCPTPDAFAIAPDGSLTLSCPNYVDGSKPGVLVSIDSVGNVSKLAELPGINEDKKARPVGIAYGKDGSLYVCDNQGPNKGRILRATFKNGELDTTEVVASGLSSPNGIRYYNGYLYVTQPRLPKFKTDKLTSGVYRFNETDRDVVVNNDSTDTQLIFTTQTQNPNRQFGLDGIEFDKEGNMYVGDFGDAVIYKLILDSNGTVVYKQVFASLPNITGIDGMYLDKDGSMYVTGFCRNQVWKVTSKGNLQLLIEYPDNNGANGELDQPVDLIVYNRKLIISNFDLMTDSGMVNKSHGKPYTLSYIDLP